MTLKVLALLTDAFGGRGGIAQYNRDFLSSLASCGLRVTAVPRHAPDPVQLPAGVVQRPARAGRIAYSLAALREAARVRPDIVFCGHIFMAPLAWLVVKLAGARLVMQMHGIEAWPRPSSLVRRSCESAALILNVSRYTRARVLDWAAIPPERVLVVPNTVADCFKPGDGAGLRREWNLEGKKVLLTVGRMATNERYKGQDRVILALSNLLAAGHDIVYIIAGEGDDRSRLEKLALDSGVSDRVRFVGALPMELLIETYRTANLFVMPSVGEGFGIALLEAMACGTPALGLDVAGARDALCDGELGISTSQRNLAAAISETLARPQPNPNALDRAVRERFGREQFRARLAAIFTEIPKTA
jgi:phosphatidyl-myo-inositol dimannoside synthase